MLDAAQLRAGAQRYKSRTREVHVPGLADPDTGDDVVLVRALSAAEFDAHQAATLSIRNDGSEVDFDKTNVSARLAVRVIVDSAGNRVLSDDDAALLGEASPNDVAAIVNAALELSDMASAVKPSEAVKGNSDATRGDESSSGSLNDTEQPPPSSSGDSTPEAG